MRTDWETSHELKLRIHSLWLMAAIAYPAWATIARWTIPSSQMNWTEFIWVSPLFVATIFVTHFIRASVPVMRGAHKLLMFSMTLHYFWLVHRDGLDLGSVIGCFVLVFAVASSFATRRALLTYSIFAISLSVLVLLSSGGVAASLLVIGMLMSLAISFVGAWDRLNTIDRLRESQQRLEFANARIESILSSVKEGFATLDEDLRYTYINPPGYEALGDRAKGFIGRTIAELSPWIVSLPIYHAMLKVQRERVMVEVQQQYPETGNWWETRIYPAENNGVAMFFRNITEAKRLEARIKEQEAKTLMSAKMSTLGEMASGIAHEINNPLTIIYGQAELLANLAKTGSLKIETLAASAEKICNTVMRISRIVKGLRAFAREGDQDPYETVSARTLIEDTLELCHQRFLNNGISISVDGTNGTNNGASDASLLQCRPTQISQILLNVLSNAYDSVQTIENERWVRIAFRSHTDGIEIRILNNGPKIDPHLHTRIFEPFFTTKEPNRGTGLGLSIARSIAESHGGRLELDVKEPQTCFVLELPKKQSSSKVKVA